MADGDQVRLGVEVENGQAPQDLPQNVPGQGFNELLVGAANNNLYAVPQAMADVASKEKARED